MKKLRKIKIKHQCTEEKSKKIAISTIIFMIIILFIAGCSIGKSITEIIIKSRLEVATPILEVISNPKIDVTAINNVGEYRFDVVNYKEEQVSEVNLRYFIEIKANVDDSVKFYLYKNGQEIKLENLCSDYITSEKGKKQDDNYVLKIVYDKTKSVDMNDILEKVQIKIHSEQEKI